MTRLDIINAALIKAGQKKAATPEATKASRLLNEQLRFSCDVVFSTSPWDELKRLVRLEHTPDVNPVYGFGYSFALPVDFIRLVEEEVKGTEYDRAIGELTANVSSFSFSYIALPCRSDVAWGDLTTWIDAPVSHEAFDNLNISGQLLNILTYHMLSCCIQGITGDHTDTQIFEAYYTKAVAKAASVSSQQKQDTFVGMNTGGWIGARQ